MQTNNMEQPRKRNNQQEQEEQREHLECPRCGSSTTKFCYYNNYNKSQPRHFCKGCKRHWTKGGTLRTIPLGGTRKNKRQKLSNTNIYVSSINHTTPINSSSGNNDYGINNNFKDDHEISFVASFQDQSNQFSCSEIGDFGSNLPLFVPKSKSLDEFGYAQMPDSSIESTITTTMHMDSSNFLSKTPWEDSFLSDSVNLSSLWDWNEINSLVSADLDVPWDDAEIKFQN